MITSCERERTSCEGENAQRSDRERGLSDKQMDSDREASNLV